MSGPASSGLTPSAPSLLRRIMRFGRAPAYPRDKAFGGLVYRGREDLLVAHGFPRLARQHFAEALRANAASGAVPAVAGVRAGAPGGGLHHADPRAAQPVR